MYWGAGRECRYSGARRGIVDIGVPRDVGAVRGCRGVRGVLGLTGTVGT